MAFSRCRSSRGFSLAEAIVAFGVMAVVALVVAALLIQLMKASQKESDRSAGSILCEKVMTQRLKQIFTGAEQGLTKEDFFEQDAPPAAPLEGTVVLNHTSYEYRIYHRTLKNTAGEAIGGDPARKNRLKKLDVVVWWWNEEANEERQGYGQLRVESSRLVNERIRFDG